MRDAKDRLMNAPFPIFSAVCDGRERVFKAQALNMADAAAWCPMAAEFQAALKALGGNYAGLPDVMAQGIDALRAYGRIEQSERVDWESLTFEQVVSALNTLFEINDPFTQAQSLQMEKLQAMGDKVTMFQKAGVDVSKFMKLPPGSE